MNKKIIVFLIISLLPILSAAESNTDNQVFDFGHIGIDFNLYHDFFYINNTEKPIKIISALSGCDCTEIRYHDSLVNPGDSVVMELVFNTRDYYGPTSKSFTVTTDNPNQPEREYFYLSNVGQWLDGIKPDPLSVFLLPGKKSVRIKIPNKFYDEISITKAVKFRDIFDLETITDEADKGEFLEIEVKANENLKNGTHLSTLTVSITPDDGNEHIVSIPVKIVRY